ncbi:MAG: ribosome recycling factor [Salibacteraceae bacterium]|jgi:ribosome recycling factor
MEEELEMIFDMAQEQMDGSIDHLKKEMLKIRTGRANPIMLSGIMVDYYGSKTPLSQVSNVNSPDAQTLMVQPFEKSILKDIEKAIVNSNVGLNPQNNGELIIINVPPLTEERRKGLAKQARSEGEHAKVSVRNARQEAMHEIKKLKDKGLSEDLTRGAEETIQTRTNGHAKSIETLISDKEVEIMKV